jgi:hypothetical protein
MIANVFLRLLEVCIFRLHQCKFIVPKHGSLEGSFDATGSNSDIACKIESEPHCAPSSSQTVAQPATSALARWDAVCEGR